MNRHSFPVTEKIRRRAVTFTIRPELIAEARSLGLNASRAAESGLEAEIHAHRQEAWLRDNQLAVDAHNRRVAGRGLLLTPPWARRDGPL